MLSAFYDLILLQIQHENNFVPTSEHRQAKVRRFLGICLYDCFIYRTNFVFLNETPSCLRSCRVTRANQNARKLPFTDLVNTNWYTAISRKVVRKNVHMTDPKCNMGYDQYTVPDTVAVKPVAFSFSNRKFSSMASRALLSNFFEEQ